MLNIAGVLMLAGSGDLRQVVSVKGSANLMPAKEPVRELVNERVRVRITVRRARPLVTVTFEAKPFVGSKHEIQKGGQLTKSGYAAPFMIDGRKAWGCDSGGGLPKLQLAKLVVQFDKKLVTVPSTLVRDCFDPHLEDAKGSGRQTGLVNARTIDRDRVLIGLLGSDGGGGYVVLWTVARNGHVSRRIGGEELLPELDKAFGR